VNTGAWVKSHKQEAMLGAGGIAVAVALYVRSRSTSGTSTTAAASYSDPATVADTTSSDAYSGIENQVTGLQSAILALGVNPGGPAIPATPAPNYAGETMSGEGYWGGQGNESPITGLNGNQYEWLSGAASQGYSGQKYYQPTPGVFAPASAYQPNTPLYLATGVTT
jgi:hypothetical protein